MHLIELHDICKTYHMGQLDVPVLKGIALTVDQGEMVALMGASGSGRRGKPRRSPRGQASIPEGSCWEMPMNQLELKEICKTYHMGELDVPVLKGITLTVETGELVALMGASGSGKTTLMNILGCLDHPTSGQYRLDNEEISGLTTDQRAILRNRKIGFVFQTFNLLPRTSALDNVIMPLSYTEEDVSDREGRQRATELLQRVGLGDRMHHEPAQLSGGQQQRVAIARALINRPRILFADEPTGNLDSHTSKEILEMFQRLNQEQGLTIILVTHDATVARHAKRVVRISDGLIENDALVPDRAGASDPPPSRAAGGAGGGAP